MRPVEEILEEITELAIADVDLLCVDVAQQRLTHIRDGKPVAVYPVSTARRGVGAVESSLMTPPGLHRVVERYGAGEPPGRVYFERVPTAERLAPAAWRAATGRDLILTRILRLDGMTPGVNRGIGIDTYRRYIYLHGSDNESALGCEPVSNGCIHVGNEALVVLFDAVAGRETWCWVE